MRSLALFTGLLSLAAALELDVVDKMRSAPPEWEKVGKPDPNTRIHFTLNVAHVSLLIPLLPLKFEFGPFATSLPAISCKEVVHVGEDFVGEKTQCIEIKFAPSC